MQTVAFLGLGKMGLGMAARLLEAQYELRLFNRTQGKSDVLVRRGARCFDTPRAACRGAAAIFSMVADDRASRALWMGPDGALSADLPPETLLIECSTLSHHWVQELSAVASARGGRYVDAPVTGLPDMAASGSLTLLVGAEPRVLQAASPYLLPLAARIIHFGPIGSGTAYKLLVNLLGAVQIASTAETMAIAEKVGLDLKQVAEALATGQAGSPQVARNARRIAEGNREREVLFTPQLRLKDVEYALALCREHQIGSPFGALAASAFRQLCDLGFSHDNESRIIEVARRQAAHGKEPTPDAD